MCERFWTLPETSLSRETIVSDTSAPFWCRLEFTRSVEPNYLRAVRGKSTALQTISTTMRFLRACPPGSNPKHGNSRLASSVTGKMGLSPFAIANTARFLRACCRRRGDAAPTSHLLRSHARVCRCSMGNEGIEMVGISMQILRLNADCLPSERIVGSQSSLQTGGT